ncbi:three component ABC system middle component [Flavobacterium sp. HJSW_4]|uniref:three component ABC system middle component n=1 Tax=Flavobacterium sp. HJSW_4 TaxID=3344660 RepID=UPI0035F3F902
MSKSDGISIGNQDINFPKNNLFIYNNEAISTIALAYFIAKVKVISIPKFMLILPFVLHEQTLRQLNNNSINRSLEEFIIKKPLLLSNFNSRYKDFLPLSINSITILNELEIIVLDREYIYYNPNGNFKRKSNHDIGDRAKKIMKGIDNLIEIITQNDQNSLYLTLKIEL